MRCPECGARLKTRWKTTLKGRLFNMSQFWVDSDVEYRRKVCDKCGFKITTYEIPRVELKKLLGVR